MMTSRDDTYEFRCKIIAGFRHKNLGGENLEKNPTEFLMNVPMKKFYKG